MANIANLKLRCLMLIGVTATIISVPAVAAESSMIEEVTVTAQRVEESIQNVPIAVTALTGDMMADKGVLSPSDLQLSSPSVNFTATNFGSSSFSIRGIGRLVIGGESGVSTHVNEIAVGTNLNSFLYDYSGLQVTRIVNNSSINENIDADIMGLEAELLWRPEAVPGLQIDASYTWIDTEVDGGRSIDPVNRTADNPDWILLNNLGPGALTGTNFVAKKAQITPAVIGGRAALGATVPVPSVSYADGTPSLMVASLPGCVWGDDVGWLAEQSGW